jgi:hypothetical protein
MYVWSGVTDGLITNNRSSFSSMRREAFSAGFHRWLSDTYPDVYEQMDLESISGSAPGFDTKNPELMLTAVEYVEEFVTQSDKYQLNPLTSSTAQTLIGVHRLGVITVSVEPDEEWAKPWLTTMRSSWDAVSVS